jgi:hypothetical protein
MIMKTINKLFLLLPLMTVGWSCRDESTIRIPNFEAGPNVRIVPDATTTNINFFSDFSQAKIKFDLYSESKNIQLIDIRVVRTSGSVTSAEASVITFTQADIDNNNGIIKGVEVALSKVATVLNVPGGLGGLKGADTFTFRNYTTLTNGVTYPSISTGTSLNLSLAIQNAPATTSFTTRFGAALVCPSTIPEGTYTATQDDKDIWFGGPNPLPSTNQVTITKVAGTANQYLLSDITAGGYFACCGASGFKLNQPAIISDVCLNISVVKGEGAQITIGQGVSLGSWDSASKTLIVHYDDVSNKSKASGADLVTKFVKN